MLTLAPTRELSTVQLNTWELEFVNCVKILLFVPLSSKIHNTAPPQAVLHAHLHRLQ